jgi:cytochrome c556
MTLDSRSNKTKILMMELWMRRFFVASAFALFCVGLASAQQDIVSARIALMKANAKSVFGDLSKIVKGTRPYDQAVVDAALAQLQDASSKIGSLYPPSTKGLKAPNDEYSASVKNLGQQAGFWIPRG